MKKFNIHIVILLPLLIVLALWLVRTDSVKNEFVIREAADSLVTVTISFVGDLMCHSTQFHYAMLNKDSFDFNPVFREVKEYLSSADLTIGNLETVIAGKKSGYSGYPFFNTPDEYIEALKEAGFDFLVTSNNHSLDRGEHGVLRTIEQIKLNGLLNTGTYISQISRDETESITAAGIDISVLAYTYGTNGIPIPEGKSYLVNLIDHNLIEKDITNARNNNPDLVIVYYHFGDEYSRQPNQYQKDVVKKTIELGADIIIGSHPHVLQPAEYFSTNGAKLNKGFSAYSLGNFISNQRWRYSDAGVILNIQITKNIFTDSIYISNVNYLPTWVFRGETDNRKEFIILPAEKYDDSTYTFLTNSDRQKMKQAFEDTKSIINSKPHNIHLLEAD